MTCILTYIHIYIHTCEVSMRQDCDQKMYVCMYIRIDCVFARRSEKQVCVYICYGMYVCMWQSFIMNSSVGSSVGASSMRAADLQALKNFKKRKADNVRVFDYLLVVVVV